MFTGIVEANGKITAMNYKNDCCILKINLAEEFNDSKVGDSISINGICFTITEKEKEHFYVTAAPETIRLTTVSAFRLNHLVNIERAMQINSRFGGHYVQGHIDCTGEIIAISPEADDVIAVKISVPQQITKFIIHKGYIGIDGMSITITAVEKDNFSVMFIPHTIQNTIVKNYHVGSKVNIEVDMLAKYIEKLLLEKKYE